MNRMDLVKVLRNAVNGREVMTIAEFCKAWGLRNHSYAKEKYFSNLQGFGKRYLITDIVEELLHEV